MKEIHDFPPNIEAIRAVLDIPKHGVIFTYGDTLYNPDGWGIDEPLWTHEKTHSEQQLQMGVDDWWEFYLIDPHFRIRQEVEAYRAQYAHYCLLVRDRNKRMAFLMKIASDLAGPTYGKAISLKDAVAKIKKNETIRDTTRFTD